jgi:hypothetical protein
MFKQHFDSYVIEGDSIKCSVEGFEVTARLVYDTGTRPEDSECYTKKQIKAFYNDDWHYFGLVLSATYNGLDCGEHLASVWAYEGNFPSRRKNPNKYLTTEANSLLGEALAQAKANLAEIRQKVLAA